MSELRVVVALMGKGRYIGLTDDEVTLLAMGGVAAAALWWLGMAARERFGARVSRLQWQT